MICLRPVEGSLTVHSISYPTGFTDSHVCNSGKIMGSVKSKPLALSNRTHTRYKADTEATEYVLMSLGSTLACPSRCVIENLGDKSLGVMQTLPIGKLPRTLVGRLLMKCWSSQPAYALGCLRHGWRLSAAQLEA